MTHSGPFQTLLLCDSVVTGRTRTTTSFSGELILLSGSCAKTPTRPDARQEAGAYSWACPRDQAVVHSTQRD